MHFLANHILSWIKSRAGIAQRLKMTFKVMVPHGASFDHVIWDDADSYHTLRDFCSKGTVTSTWRH
jgi:hypothetical protein